LTALLSGSSGNVYADWRYADPKSVAMKARFVARITDLIRERGLSQEGATKVLSLTQPKISQLLKGQIRRISEPRLLRYLTKLGREVEIVVKPAPQRRSGWHKLFFAAERRQTRALVR
jgi:predicted XRE-type DNA-binding protein